MAVISSLPPEARNETKVVAAAVSLRDADQLTFQAHPVVQDRLSGRLSLLEEHVQSVRVLSGLCQGVARLGVGENDGAGPHVNGHVAKGRVKSGLTRHDLPSVLRADATGTDLVRDPIPPGAREVAGDSDGALIHDRRDEQRRTQHELRVDAEQRRVGELEEHGSDDGSRVSLVSDQNSRSAEMSLCQESLPVRQEAIAHVDVFPRRFDRALIQIRFLGGGAGISDTQSTSLLIRTHRMSL